MKKETVAKPKVVYKCSNCGCVVLKWQGQCHICRQWNTFKEFVEQPYSPSHKGKTKSENSNTPVKLKEVEVSKETRIQIKNQEFNRVMGGGIVRDSVTILTAPPGSGKSTLLLTVAQELGEMGYIVYYVSGEESLSQIRSRANRIIHELSDNIWIQSENNMENIELGIERINPDVIIVDSIQTIYSDSVSSKAGSPSQIDECTQRLISIAKNPLRPRAVFIVGQMTKEDELAGNRTLEHVVDTVLYLEGDRTQQLRILSCRKNRFGDTGEIGFLSMETKGLIPIENPSEFFMAKREQPVSGSALTVTKEGSRVVVVEVESLVEKTLYGFPARVSEGIGKQQLQILCGTLEKRGGIPLSDKDVYVKISGGLKLSEPATNLGVAVSIVSSVYNRGIPTDTVFVGDVGLTGEIKHVPYIESRIKELERLGFRRLFLPKGNLHQPIPTKHLNLIEVATLDEVIQKLYS